MSDSIERAIGRLEGKIDMILAGQVAQTKTSEDHEERITKIEGWQGRILGGAAVLGVIGGLVVKVLF